MLSRYSCLSFCLTWLTWGLFDAELGLRGVPARPCPLVHPKCLDVASLGHPDRIPLGCRLVSKLSDRRRKKLAVEVTNAIGDQSQQSMPCYHPNLVEGGLPGPSLSILGVRSIAADQEIDRI